MDWGKVVQDMLNAAKKSAGKDWGKLRDYAENEFKNLATVASQIDDRKKKGTITEINASFLMGQYQAASRGVMFAIESLTNLVIQNAWNAAMLVLSSAINTAIGWALL
ncbi:TPA: hypothetical protein JD824_RS16370 [Citrobacter freundii]|jgi:hypothetical protein|uniref:hypothetical protein n=1 Tax=Citrobacter TaxID=544 RepID=UPI001A1B80DA|nr:MULTISPECIES: hypothetical protein [Citrobacter]MCR3708453.1 hypothetical protein [Citrobacter freundii]MCY3449442.1 hypothetical protein [Citrobacter freundii]MDM3160663.1 hypothetical protein [Citrobacter sp. Cf118]MEB1069259.1 hypothetical protein [Citrobacter freundii]HBV2907886.1 hypothetical protein [Citrobacter freundii]